MDLFEALRILRARWILTSVMLILALGATAVATIKLPRTYIASSSVVLLASPSLSKPNGNNPYLSFDGSLNSAGDVVRYEVMSPLTAKALAAEGYSASYVVADALDTPGPVLDVTVTGHNKALVDSTLLGVTTDLNAKLKALQADVTNANRITMITLSYGSAKLSKSKLARPIVVVLGFGLVLAFAVPLLVDARARERRARAQTAPLPSTHSPRDQRGAQPVAPPRGRVRVDPGEYMRGDVRDRVRADRPGPYDRTI
jgi:hypothetical protein